MKVLVKKNVHAGGYLFKKSDEPQNVPDVLADECEWNPHIEVLSKPKGFKAKDPPTGEELEAKRSEEIEKAGGKSWSPPSHEKPAFDKAKK